MSLLEVAEIYFGVFAFGGTLIFSVYLNQEYIDWYNRTHDDAPKRDAPSRDLFFGFELMFVKIAPSMSEGLALKLRIHRIVFPGMLAAVSVAALVNACLR